MNHLQLVTSKYFYLGMILDTIIHIYLIVKTRFVCVMIKERKQIIGAADKYIYTNIFRGDGCGQVGQALA